MKVAYITYPHFLDTCIERIKELSTKVDLYVYVMIAPYSLKSTVAEFTVEYNENQLLYELDEIATNEDINKLYPYFKNCKEVKFVMMPEKSLSFRAVERVSKFKRAIHEISPNIIHLQEPAIILWSMARFLKKYPVVMSIHDTQPHTGESSWRKNFIKKLLFKSADTFELYSEYSTNEFISTFKIDKTRVLSTELLPYTIYKTFAPITVDLPIDFEKEKVILFYGRISKYKGVEFLMESFQKLQETTKNVKLIIAGKSNYQLQIPEKCKDLIDKSIFILNRYIHNGEVTFLMKNSDILVCPYTDATQSGVIMTAISFEIPVIVSNMGALPEQVQKYNCGYVMKDYNVDILFSLLSESINTGKRERKFNCSTVIDKTITKILTEYKRLESNNR